MSEFMIKILDIRQLYFGKSMVFGLFLASVLWLLAREQKPAAKVLGYGSAAYVLLVMNPLAVNTYFSWFDKKGIYWELLLFLPLLPVMGYVFAEAVSKGKKRIEKAAMIIAFTFVIVLSGSLAFSYGAFEKRETKGKLEQEAVNIIPYIESAGEEGYVIVPDTLLPNIRDYTGNITLLYSRSVTADNSTICYGDEDLQGKAKAIRELMNTGLIEARKLADAAKDAGVVLIVLNAGTCDVQQMEENGYKLIGYNTKYEVYKC